MGLIDYAVQRDKFNQASQERKVKIWEIWIEGYLATGMDGIPAKAQKIGKAQAETFQQACDVVCSPKDWQESHGNYDRDRLTVWGCKLFDNELDARRSFG